MIKEKEHQGYIHSGITITSNVNLDKSLSTLWN